MSIIKVNNIHTTDSVKVMSNGSMQHQNKTTITETITIPSGSNGLMAGPVTIPTLVVNGNLNVVDSLTVSSGNLTITGHLRIS